MQGKDLLTFLTDPQGRSYYVDNGLVQLSAQPRPLEYDPVGLDEIEIQNTRNQKYFALDRAVTLPSDFVEDGATILKDAYYKKGLGAKVYQVLSRQKLYYDGNQYGYYYEGFHRGAVDFSEFNHVGPKTTVSISEDGPVKYIKANENAVYEFDLDVPEAMKIRMDGVKLRQSANYLLSNGALPNDLGGATIALTLLGDESISSIGAVSESRVKTGNAAGPLWNANTWFLLTGSQETEVTLEWDFNVGLQLAEGVGGINPTSIILQLIVLESDSSTNNIPLQTLSVHDPLLIYNHKHHFTGSFTTTIPANRRCMLYMTANQNREFTFFTYDSDGSFKVNYTYTHRTTYIKALPPLYLFRKLIEKVTEGKYQADSSLLANVFNVPITCGDAIRGISSAKVKTSLYKFFQAQNVEWCAGMGEINKVVRLEEKKYWVDYSDPVDLGEVSNLSVKPALDYYFNSVNAGYEPQEYNDVNGRQEFNNTNKYTGPAIEVSQELDLVSPYRADCYGIEFIRINLEGKTTTDSDSDNDVALIHVNAAPINDPVEGLVYTLNRDLNATATGLLEPQTVFNLFLSPARCLLRNGSYVRSCTYKMDSEFLTWQTTDKNADLACGGVVEKANINIGSLGAALFTPNLLEFDAPSIDKIFTELAKRPACAFKFRYLGIELKGIAFKVSIRPADYAAQTFQLLSAPENNLEQLINVME